jgi:arylsulfatase A-like enzyme
VSFEQPHPPFVPPAEYWELYRDIRFPAPVRGDWVDTKTPGVHRELQGRSNLFDWLGQEHVVQQNLRGYAAMITHIDAMVGVLVGQLSEYGLLNNTHIIFTSDHGEALFDHEACAKGTPFHGPANIPMIVAPSTNWVRQQDRPDLLGRPGLSAPAGLADVLPTILDLCGQPCPNNVEGQSLVPFAREESPDFREWTFSRYACNYGATNGRYTYMWFADETDVELLFDRDADPRECHDLINDPAHADIRQAARGALVDWMTRNADEHIVDGQPRAMPFGWVNEYTHTKSMFALRGRR